MKFLVAVLKQPLRLVHVLAYSHSLPVTMPVRGKTPTNNLQVTFIQCTNNKAFPSFELISHSSQIVQELNGQM